jgi:hypothetical protein
MVFWLENLNRRDHSEDLIHRWRDNVRMEIQWEDMDCMHLAQARDQWQAVENMVMNLQVL